MKLTILPALVSLALLVACTKSEAPQTQQLDVATAATCANFLKGKTQMNLKQVLTCAALVCATYPAACSPKPVPVPPPVPSAMGGNASTGGSSAVGGGVATGGQAATGGTSAVVQFPACSDTMKAPSPAQIDQYRRTLKPRHKGHAKRERSPVMAADAAWANVFWTSNLAEPLDQGNLGSCVGNAMAHCVSTQPFGLKLTESDAIKIYDYATTIDPFAGQRPQQDTGSDGASGCKSLVHFGYAKTCTNFAGYTDAMTRVQVQPITVGMAWLEKMFVPNSCGGLDVSGAVAGGHQVTIVGYDAGNKRVWLVNSWGQWGVCLGSHCGYFYLGVNDLAGSKLDAEFDAPNLN